MNKRRLSCVWPEGPRAIRKRYNKSNRVVGYTAQWSDFEGDNLFYKDMPFKVKMFHKIHVMVHHGAVGGNSRSWKAAAKRLEAHMPWFSFQTDSY